jgi:hypothetical protein
MVRIPSRLSVAFHSGALSEHYHAVTGKPILAPVGFHRLSSA